MDITTVKESHQSLFDELMSSREEHETSRDSSSSEKRRVTLHCPGSFVDHPFTLNVPKAFSNTVAGERELSEQVDAYNRRQSKQFHIRLQEDEQVYSGLLKFNYFSGQEEMSENVHVNNATTTEDLIPELLNRFLPSLESRLDALEGSHHTYIALVQGDMERELKSNEKPLQIALDCSSKGLASPKFVFKTSLTTQAALRDGEPHQTDGFTSYVGTLAVHSSSESCNSSRRHSKVIEGEPDQTSMNSYGSAVSLSSNKSNKSKSTSSLNLKAKKPLSHTLSNQETSPKLSPNQRRHTHIPHGTASPINRKQSRPKSVMSNFITRSLRVRKKSKLTTSPGPTPTGTPALTDSDATLLAANDDDNAGMVSTLVSPLPLERKFTMSAVMHIYFTEAKQTQVYKSVLVSEKATTREVIAQALERYNMKVRDPNGFVLCEVIGKWQDVTSTLPANASFQINHPSGISGATTSLPGLGFQSASPAINRRTSVEEFVECYTRELSPEEHPYSAQFFLTTQEGFTRRFELRSRAKMDKTRRERTGFLLDKSSTASNPALVASDRVLRHQAMSFDDTNDGIFGQTAHRRRARRHHMAQHSADAADDLKSALDSSILGLADCSASLDKQLEDGAKRGNIQQIFSVESEKRENSELRILDHDEVEEIAIIVNPHHPPDFAALTCSSPDSGVAFQKSSAQVASSSAKSSISSEQSEQKSATSTPCGIYKAKLNTAFLLSLHLHSPEREYLVHKLGSDKTIIASASNSDDCTDNPNISEINSESCIVLHHPKLANYKNPICCICHQPIKTDGGIGSGCTRQFILSNVDSNVPLLVNGQVMSSDTAPLRHGDLFSIGDAYLFMFQDYSSVSGEYIPDYNWKPLPSPVHVGTSVKVATKTSTKSSLGVAEQSVSTSIGVDGTTHESNHLISTQGGENMTQQHWRHQKDASLSSESEVSVVIEDTDSNVISMIDTRKVHGKSKSLSLPRIESLDSPPQRSETDPAVTHSNSAHQLAQGHGFETSIDSATQQQQSLGAGDGHLEAGEVFEPSPTVGPPIKSTQPTKPTKPTKVHTTKVKHIYAIPKDRKLVFSFMPSEEELLLDHVIMKNTTAMSACKLTPSYILAMCIEYSMMCNGPQSTMRFVQKATDRIQEVVWECTTKVAEWQPDPERARNPLSLMNELFLLLQPVFFWLANILEFYQFLTTHHSSLNLPLPSQEREGGNDKEDELRRVEEENPLVTLQNVMIYTFQQAFYPVSKVLFHSLPVMLERCVDYKLVGGGAEPIVIDQAVDFLQALLDLLTELHVHLEVISQFYSNIFFFINASMLNSLVEQGVQLQLYQYSCGTALRANLNLLEGWACQVGFKDSILHYLAKFSSAIDLLATPSEQLLQLNWHHLRREFPVLNPAQLHHIVSHYLLPPKMINALRHWTPSRDEAPLAFSDGNVEESFDHHPRFSIPKTGYMLDLSKPPPEPDHFQAELESLRRNLKKPTRSVDIVPVIESRPCASIPTIITSVVTTTTSVITPPLKRAVNIGIHSHKGSHSQSGLDRIMLDESPPRNRRNIGSNTESQEDLLEDRRNNRRNFRERLRNTDLASREDMINSYEQETDGESERQSYMLSLTSRKERVERVRSLHAPRSFNTPEKLVIESPNYLSGDKTDIEWLKAKFPPGAKLVTVPRGDKGFGFIMVEGNDSVSGDTAIFIQRVLPGSTAETCNQLNSGDQILAIDGQLLDGADFLIADKYLKQAEDDVSLVLVPKTLLTINQ